MMSALQFEAVHGAEWAALAQQLEALEARRDGVDAARLASRYRRLCEQLALAQARAYPLHLAERLDALAQRAHRLIYRTPPQGMGALRRLLLQRFPQVLRAQRGPQLLALLAFAVPLLLAALATRLDPTWALTLLSAEQLTPFDGMYGDDSESFGRTRDAATDWAMFGYYIRNNISVAFQCFATGLLGGLGSLFFLVYNGLLIGTIAGYLDGRGLGHNFWPFVATHGAFELTAIVISGGAGLRLGQALLAPGRLTRVTALRQAGSEGAVLISGAAAMLLLAAAVEAFWSSAPWVAAEVKFGVAAVCWTGVATYFWRAGRGADLHAD